jgi:hypothetical protein
MKFGKVDVFKITHTCKQAFIKPSTPQVFKVKVMYSNWHLKLHVHVPYFQCHSLILSPSQHTPTLPIKELTFSLQGYSQKQVII